MDDTSPSIKYVLACYAWEGSMLCPVRKSAFGIHLIVWEEIEKSSSAQWHKKELITRQEK